MFSRYCSNANLYHGPVTLAPTDEDFWLLLELAGALKVAARVSSTKRHAGAAN
jgi:hypothetical protein